MNIDNFKLRTKILIPGGLLVLVVFGMVAFSAAKLAAVSGTASDIIERRDMTVIQLARAGRFMFEASYSAIGALFYDADSPEGRAAAEGFRKAAAGAGSGFDEAMKLAPDKAPEIAKFKERFQALVEKSKAVAKIGQGIPPLSAGRKLKPEELDQFAEGAVLVADIDAQTRGTIDEMVKFDNALLAENAQAAADLRAQSSGSLVAMGVVGLLATMIVGAFTLWLSSSKIAGPLSRLSERMDALAKGDLAVEIEGQGRRDEIGEMSRAVLVFKEAAIENARLEREAGEHRAQAEGERARNEQAQRQAIEQERAIVASSIGAALSKLAAKDLAYRLPADIPEAYRKLQVDFNAAIGQLEEAMRTVTASSSAIHSGTQEISAASDDLARRTEQQAASLEETAAALDEITATVKKSAEGAAHARQVVVTADEDAKKSAVVVRQAVEAMGAIAKSAQQISQIIGVIDEIAFQTNLLALNAGVEAARAGDAGRGFAVVASEVRALAQRSAEAAKEIKGLISTSTTQVDHGVNLVAETGKSLERIMAQVTEINRVVSEIAAGAQEQASGLQQINIAINQMDQTTQQNASMVEESTAASHSLSQEADQLSGLIGQFQVGSTSADAALRNRLQKAAPHIFRQLAKAPAGPRTEPRLAAGNPAPEPHKAAVRPARAAFKAAANGASASAGDDSIAWEEF
jgi:methyl-accepting chemotaxis protein